MVFGVSGFTDVLERGEACLFLGRRRASSVVYSFSRALLSYLRFSFLCQDCVRVLSGGHERVWSCEVSDGVFRSRTLASTTLYMRQEFLYRFSGVRGVGVCE